MPGQQSLPQGTVEREISVTSRDAVQLPAHSTSVSYIFPEISNLFSCLFLRFEYLSSTTSIVKKDYCVVVLGVDQLFFLNMLIAEKTFEDYADTAFCHSFRQDNL